MAITTTTTTIFSTKETIRVEEQWSKQKKEKNLKNTHQQLLNI